MVPEIDPLGAGDPESFLLRMAQPYYHPLFPDFYLQLIADSLFATNIPDTGENESFRIRSFPVGQWSPLKDQYGHDIPAQVLLPETGQLYASWT